MTKNSVANALHSAMTVVGDDLDVLIGAAVDGDRDAVEGVLSWIRPLVLRYCRARVGSQEKTFGSADDVAQEACLAVLTALPRYRDQGRPFLAFVYGIAAHKVADAYRSAARNRAEPVPEIPDTPDELADGPEAQVMQGELAGRMNKLLGTLPDKQREILILRIVVGLSAEETAEAVGSTPGAVRVAQHRALGRLRSVLASENDETHRIQTHVAVTKPADDPSEDAKELDNPLADADHALRQKLRAPAVISSKVCGIESAEDEYIDQLLRIADIQLRQKLGMGDADHFELA